MSKFYVTSTHFDEITPFIKLVADYGADVNARNKYDKILLLIAIGCHAENVIEAMVRQGVNAEAWRYTLFTGHGAQT
jgi:hypothetical protein